MHIPHFSFSLEADSSQHHQGWGPKKTKQTYKRPRMRILMKCFKTAGVFFNHADSTRRDHAHLCGTPREHQIRCLSQAMENSFWKFYIISPWYFNYKYHHFCCLSKAHGLHQGEGVAQRRYGWR